MIKLRAHPVVHGVALLARDRQPQRNVIDANGLSDGEILLVAGVARRREPLKLPNGSACVALIAIQRGVRTNQRETIYVLIDLLHRNVPPPDGVTLLAVRPHLTLVDVSLAVGALLADIAEDGLGVALGAAHALMHTAQRIFGCVVIEFRNSADRLPAAEGMTVLAGDAKAPVRTARVRGRLRLSTCHRSGRESRQRDHKMQ